MKNLSKTKLLAYRQCPKRLWLEVNRKDLRQDSATTQANFDVGNQVGDIARRLYDPEENGELLEMKRLGVTGIVARTSELLPVGRPIFEAGFAADGAEALADLLMPVAGRGPKRWRMIEVKSSASVKDYHRDDVAIQSSVARRAGLRLASVSVAHIDSSWTYPGSQDYAGLLVEVDLTAEAFSREAEVKTWIAESQAVLRKRAEPVISTGAQCQLPYACGFIEHCSAQEPQAEYPVAWLPNVRTKALKAYMDEHGPTELHEVPDELLNETQLRVKRHTLAGTVYFDASGARADLAKIAKDGWPAYFMDFETINLAVPIWPGTRPFQQIPFQFSVHRLARNGRMSQEAFIDLSGQDPSKAFARALIDACGDTGPVFAYNASFERTCLKALAARLPPLARKLLSISERVVDLLPVAQRRFYHPMQQGSWSIKDVLPAIAPDLSYDRLAGVADGAMAMDAYREAIAQTTRSQRREEIRSELLEYCALDTLAMVRLWQHFAGRAKAG